MSDHATTVLVAVTPNVTMVSPSPAVNATTVLVGVTPNVTMVSLNAPAVMVPINNGACRCNSKCNYGATTVLVGVTNVTAVNATTVLVGVTPSCVNNNGAW